MVDMCTSTHIRSLATMLRKKKIIGKPTTMEHKLRTDRYGTLTVN
jgi:hypothetical protein